MKGMKPLCLIAVLAAALASGMAVADRGHGHGHGHGHSGGSHIGLGFYFGGPYAYPYYYSPYPYYVYPYPLVIAAPASPPVYIERGAEQDEEQSDAYYWYHCDNPEGYYPYVKNCPGGWQQVEPEPVR